MYDKYLFSYVLVIHRELMAYANYALIEHEHFLVLNVLITTIMQTKYFVLSMQFLNMYQNSTLT